MSLKTDPQPGQVRIHSDRHVGWLTLDNPRKRNSMSLAMWGALTEAVIGFERDPDVRCIVIRGAGGDAFCAGADVAEKQGTTADRAFSDAEFGQAGRRAIEDCTKPVVAMIEGYCLGAGLVLALACDIRIAAEGASFGIPAARLGLGLRYSGAKRLVDAIGSSQAKRLIFTADRIATDRALSIGLIDEVCPTHELNSRVDAMTQRIASNAPLTITAAKYAVAMALADPANRDLTRCEDLMRTCLASNDYVEGRKAFREKRSPDFTGR